MAKKKRTRELTAEQKMVQQLSDMLKAAGFSIQHQLDLGSKGRPDLVAEREDLGMYRRYAIDVAVVNEPEHLVRALNALQSYAETRKDRDFDEYWLVSNLSYSQDNRRRRPRFQNVRAFAFKELERMLARQNSKKRLPKPKTGKATTRIGKAVEANEREINLAISGLILQIDEKLERLGNERPNSDEAMAKLADEISDLERMKVELERIRELVAQFQKGKAAEKEVVKATKTFKDDIQRWWDKGHDSLLTTAAKSALFVSSVGVLALMKADSPTAIAVAGALIGGKAIKTIKKLGKKLFS